MASVIWKDGSWKGRLRVNRRQKQLTLLNDDGSKPRNKGEARRALQRYIVDQERGEQVDHSRLTVESCLQRWLAAVKPGLTGQTPHTYRWGIERVGREIGQVGLQSLTVDDVVGLRDTLAQGLAPRSVNLCLELLSFAIAWRMRQPGRIVRVNVASADVVSRLTIRHAEVYVPSLADIRSKLLPACEGAWLGRLIRLAVRWGLREMELAALWETDLEGSFLTVRRSYYRAEPEKGQPGRLVVKDTKNAHWRRIPLSADDVVSIKDQAAENRATRLHMQVDWPHPELLFPTKFGTPQPASSIRLAWKQVLSATGLPAMKFHLTRHMADTRLVEAGVPDAVRRAIIGHLSSAMDATYVHIGDVALMAAVASLEKHYERSDGDISGDEKALVE